MLCGTVSLFGAQKINGICSHLRLTMAAAVIGRSIAGDIFFLEDCNVLSLPSRNDGVGGLLIWTDGL